MSGPELSPIPREARRFQGESAGIVSRFLANTIDALVVALVVGGGYLGWVGLQFLVDPRSFTWPDTRWVVVLTVWMATATLYLTLTWWLSGGRTYGNHVMGLRVVGRRGHRLGPLRSVMRAAFCVFFPIGLFWCLVSPKRRSVQDAVLWTKVVYDWTPRPADRRPGEHREGAIGGPVVESVVVAEGSSESRAAGDVAPDPPQLRRRSFTRPPAAAVPPVPPSEAVSPDRPSTGAATDAVPLVPTPDDPDTAKDPD